MAEHVNSDALTKAINADDVLLLKRLVQNGADVNATDNNGMLPLQVAIRMGNVAIVRTLLERGADPYLETRTSISPMAEAMVAANYEREFRNMRILLDAGLDADLPGEKAITPLMVASMASVDAMRLLMQYGANPNAQDIDGNTPLIYAARIDACHGPEERAIERAHCLLSGGANRAMANQEGQTALDVSMAQFMCPRHVVDEIRATLAPDQA